MQISLRTFASAAVPVIVFALPNSNLLAAGDAARGQAAFVAKACAGCHQVGASAVNAFGPVLNGVFGRAAGTYPGYQYSAGLRQAGKKGVVWDEKSLKQWLNGPSAFLKKALGNGSARSKMPVSFPGDALQADLIAYLKSLQ